MEKNQNFIGLPYTFLRLHDVFILDFKLEVEIDHNFFSALEAFVLLTDPGQWADAEADTEQVTSHPLQLPPSSLWHSPGSFEIAL